MSSISLNFFFFFRLLVVPTAFLVSTWKSSCCFLLIDEEVTFTTSGVFVVGEVVEEVRGEGKRSGEETDSKENGSFGFAEGLDEGLIGFDREGGRLEARLRSLRGVTLGVEL